MSEPNAPAGQPTEKKPMSTGTKAVLGCLVVLALLAVAGSVAMAMGGFFLKRTVDAALGGVGNQVEATETLGRLREEHPFEAPDDGAVTEEQVGRFLAATDDAWERMEAWAGDLRELAERQQAGDRSGVGDLVDGARAMSGFARARVELAEALEENDMSLGEYAWIGLSLTRALEVAEGEREAPGVPAANVALATEYRNELPRLDSEDGSTGPGLVLATATIFGMTEGATWEALGLDTLGARGR